jgi:zinc transporter ZupT
MSANIHPETAAATALQAGALFVVAYLLTSASVPSALSFGVCSALGSRCTEKLLDDHYFNSADTSGKVAKYAISFFSGIGIGISATTVLRWPIRAIGGMLSTTGIIIGVVALIVLLSLYFTSDRSTDP